MNESIPSRERPAKLLETATAAEHSELQIISRCLDEASLALKLYFARSKLGLPENEDEAAIRRALFRDGLIQLMACFTINPSKRDRFLIPSETFDGQEGWETFYKWLLDLRDGYAAHNFGAQRLADSIAFLDSDTGQVAGIGIIIMGFDGPTEGEESFATFCVTAKHHAKSRMEQASAKLLSEAQALSKAELEAFMMPHSSCRGRKMSGRAVRNIERRRKALGNPDQINGAKHHKVGQVIAKID